MNIKVVEICYQASGVSSDQTDGAILNCLSQSSLGPTVRDPPDVLPVLFLFFYQTIEHITNTKIKQHINKNLKDDSSSASQCTCSNTSLIHHPSFQTARQDGLRAA